MKNLDNYYLWQIPANIDLSLSLSLSRLADLCWKIPQEAISRINSRSFWSSHYIVTQVINIEQYDKGDEWM